MGRERELDERRIKKQKVKGSMKEEGNDLRERERERGEFVVGGESKGQECVISRMACSLSLPFLVLFAYLVGRLCRLPTLRFSGHLFNEV